MALFFAVTLFVSAFLLFLVQPMVGKMVLPLLGGAPAAWATCMVFFQGLLLAGYAYAHAAVGRFGARRQSLIHLTVLALPLIVLGITAIVTGAPIRAFKALVPQSQSLPFFGAIALLAAAVGLPFFVVSTSAPLLQRWFAETDHPAARDPYFLYAASNFGSLLALVAYPFLVEPVFPLATQGWLWSAGYLLLVGLTTGCAWKLGKAPAPPPERQRGFISPAPPVPGHNSRLRWLALAFIPSSLLLSVTQFITTDVAPVPGLWVLPLAVYLLTFVVAFGRSPSWVRTAVALAAPIAVLMMLFMLLTDRKPESLGLLLAVHLTVFLLVALNCHIDLARRRPEPARLTEFYLWVSLGGVLGGLFNSLVAPLVFTDLTEYPLALIAACLLQPSVVTGGRPASRLLDVAAPLIVAALAAALFLCPIGWLPLVATLPVPAVHSPFYRWATVIPFYLWTYVVNGVPLLASYLWVDRPVRFGLCVAAAWLVLTVGGEISKRRAGDIILRDRSFFGVLALKEEVALVPPEVNDAAASPEGVATSFHRLVHGTTLHGLQQSDPPSGEPLTYYHRTGPIGQLFTADPPAVKQGRFAFVGLGSGSLAYYGREGQSITFYEIDPAVRRIAENPEYFTYLSDCKMRLGNDNVTFVMGDARLKLEEYTGPKYGLIVVDAFSSDAIPIHLLTKEAMQLYFDKLADDGIIALHLSNRYLHLERVAARLAEELRRDEPHLTALYQWDSNDTFDWNGEGPKYHIPGKSQSQWVLLARNAKCLEPLMHVRESTTFAGRSVHLWSWDREKKLWTYPWTELKVNSPSPLWTDDFSNLTQILNWDYILPTAD